MQTWKVSSRLTLFFICILKGNASGDGPPMTGIRILRPERQLYVGGCWEGMELDRPALCMRPKGWTINASMAVVLPLAIRTCEAPTAKGR